MHRKPLPVVRVLPNRRVRWSPHVHRAFRARLHAIRRLIRITIPPIAWAFSDTSALSLPTPIMDTTIPAGGGKTSVFPSPTGLPLGRESYLRPENPYPQEQIQGDDNFFYIQF